MDGRLPAHLEATAIRRIAESMGGFATVLSRGDKDAGTIAIVIIVRGEPARLYERMPQMDGSSTFVCTTFEDIENKQNFSEILKRRCERDPDLWIIEADIPERERFVAALPG